MYWSRNYIPTLKEDPAEAEVISHKLLLRAGMIRKLASGIYSYLPAGWRSLQKISRIVREEMDRFGAVEIRLPAVQPGDIWKESGRWEHYGKELLRFRDRHDRDYCMGPTHEEVITDLVRGEIRSYKQLPVNMYQVQTKFRDEIRPRFGLMRGREFIMKDAYSFDRDEDGAARSYEEMRQAYESIFSRLGLEFRGVDADSGAIGGSVSQEFMVLAETGEDIIVVCPQCAYAANLEKAEVAPPPAAAAQACPELKKVKTPDAHTVEQVAAYLDTGKDRILKTLLYEVDGRAVAVMVRGDRDLNEVKLKNFLNATDLELASAEKVRKWSGAPVGFSGPVGLEAAEIFADQELENRCDFVVGANANDAHYLHFDPARDCRVSAYADLREIVPDDPCPGCGENLEFTRGIEVGHIFMLGTKYSRALKASFLDENGKEKPLIMGCYGIGISRVLAACIEQNHDENGIIYPPAIAPWEVLIVAINPKDEKMFSAAADIHDRLQGAGVECLLDDRAERPGVKFKDADLIGIPVQVVVGAKGLERGVVEIKVRKTGEKTEVALEDLTGELARIREKLWASPNKSEKTGA